MNPQMINQVKVIPTPLIKASLISVNETLPFSSMFPPINEPATTKGTYIKILPSTSIKLGNTAINTNIKPPVTKKLRLTALHRPQQDLFPVTELRQLLKQ